MMRVRQVAACAFSLALVHCSGGGAPVVSPAHVEGTLALTIPNAVTRAPAGRHAHFLSPSAKSVSIAVGGVAPVIADVSVTSQNCTPVTTGRSCTIAVSAPTGTVNFSVTLFDGAGATGNILGSGSATQTVTAGTPFTVAVGVAGKAGAVAITAAQTAFVSGTAASTPLTIVVNDADGNAITGTYASPVLLLNSDTTGAFALSATTVTSSTQTVTLTYNGSAAVTTATISANASGLLPANVTPQTLSVAPPSATGHLYVADFGNNTATVFPLAATGNATPTQNIAGTNTQISQEYGITADAVGNIYSSNLRVPVITVYAPGATGNVAPIRTITGTSTGLSGPLGLAIDSAGELVADNFFANTVTVFATGANGNAVPIRTIAGSNTGLNATYGIALDASGKLYVCDESSQFGGTDSITVYAAGANGNVAPVQTITGSATGLFNAVYDAVDASGKLYVSNAGAHNVTVYAAGATGNVAPIATIGGTTTTLVAPQGIAVDAAGNIYVADSTTNAIDVFAPGANGNVAPIRVIAGAATGISSPLQLTIGL